MARGGFSRLRQRLTGRADIVCVYVVEAHARDEWPLGLKRSVVAQHKTLDDRIQAKR